MANPTVVLHGKDDVRLDNLQEEEPKEGEVAVSMRECGICGSDTHMIQVADGSTTVLLGHEASGVVSKLGKGVTTFKLGDRVALEPGDACNACKNCYRGLQNTCLGEKPYMRLGGGTGFMTRTKVMKASYCHKLPDNVSDEEGAFMEPLAVAVYDCQRGGVGAGMSVLVLGAGTIGLLCMMTAKSMGAKTVCITDIMEDRLKLATELGANQTVLTGSRDHNDVMKEIHEKMGEEPDIVLECTGVEWCIQLSILAVVPGGTVCIIGRGAPNVSIPIAIANERQITINNCWRYDRFCFPIAIDLVSKGAVDVARLVTHRYGLQQAKEAFQTAIQRNPGVLKVMVKCNSD